MNIVQIIEKKVSKKELTKEELEYAFLNYLNGNVKDYQISSLLMAILLNGMTDNELFIYTEILINSGKKIVFEDWEQRVDKHSTGGIGDKISLILSPILAANGIHIAKISGRGLGFTGGTIDKLESIEGFNVNLSIDQFINFSKNSGISLTSTTNDFSPLDKAIYALRDVTGTVSSVHLVAASIMSKKLLTNSKNIIIDLKCGEGAFFKTQAEAKIISDLFIKIANKFDRKIFIFISNMNAPLGNFVGNWLEVYEAKEILSGNLNNNHAFQLSKIIAIDIISEIKNISLDASQKLVEDSITSKKALDSFKTWIENQGGNFKKLISDPKKKTIFEYVIKAYDSGFVEFHNILNIGYGLIEIDGGRKTKDDSINPNVGFEFLVQSDDQIEKYSDIIKIYSDKELDSNFLEKIQDVILINKQKTNFKLLFGKEINVKQQK